MGCFWINYGYYDEGFDDGSTREFIRFLGYSQRSYSEVQTQLYRALDCI